jgi:hypothetical protein
LDELRNEVAALRDANASLAADVAMQATAASEGQARTVELEADLLAAEAQGDDARAEALRLEERIASLERELAAETSRVEDLGARLEVSAKFLAESEAQRIEASKELEALRQEIDDLRAGPVTAPGTESFARESTTMVEAWAKAWSEQRVEDFLAFYSNTFEPSDGSSRASWEAERRERISSPARIDVRVALTDLRRLDDDRVEVTFLQSYESDRVTDVVLKTLELLREGGNWRIAAERVE